MSREISRITDMSCNVSSDLRGFFWFTLHPEACIREFCVCNVCVVDSEEKCQKENSTWATRIIRDP